jgi:hypothetical protein
VRELEYEPRVIEMHAQRLNRRADSMGVTSAVIGAVIGGFFGAVPLTSLGDAWPIPSQFGFGTLLLGVLLGALTGYVIGDARGFDYRLQAQSSLCQLQLERNTAALLLLPTLDAQPVRPEPPVELFFEAAPRYTEPEEPFAELPEEPFPEPATSFARFEEPLADPPAEPFEEPEVPFSEPARPFAEPVETLAAVPDLDKLSLEEIARLASSGLLP